MAAGLLPCLRIHSWQGSWLIHPPRHWWKWSLSNWPRSQALVLVLQTAACPIAEAIWIGYFGDQHKITPWEQIFMVMRVKTQKSDFNGRLLFTVLASIFNFSLEIIETCVWEKLGGNFVEIYLVSKTTRFSYGNNRWSYLGLASVATIVFWALPCSGSCKVSRGY